MSEGYKKWQCMSCGEIYDEELGLPDEGVPAGTRFEDLPEDWICPACGSNKSDFILLED
jgi:rubredoxin